MVIINVEHDDVKRQLQILENKDRHDRDPLASELDYNNCGASRHVEGFGLTRPEDRLQCEPMKVNLSKAKSKLPKLIRAVEDNTSVTICRRGVPVVDMVPTKQRTLMKRNFGTLKG